MTQNSAYFFYEQKVLAEDPSGADQTSYYESNFDTTALNSVKSAGLSLLSEAAWGTVTTNIQQEASGDGDKCPTAGSSRTASSYAFNDGSTGTNAYAAGADCTWEFSPSSSNSYVNIDITRLLSEQGVFKAGGEYDAVWRPYGDVYRPVGPDQTAADPLKYQRGQGHSPVVHGRLRRERDRLPRGGRLQRDSLEHDGRSQ